MDKVISKEFKWHMKHAPILKRRLLKYGITSFDFGKKYVRGQETDLYALTCYVKQKLDLEALSRSHSIPKKIIYQVDGIKYEILTDVAQAKPKIVLQTKVSPGEKLYSQSSFATIGLVGKHANYGDILVTAGHFAEQGENVVIPLDNKKYATASVEYSTSGSVRDFAILKIIDRSDYPKTPRWEGYYDAVKIEDVGRKLYVATEPFSFEKKTICRSVSAYFYDEDNDVSYEEVISTDRVTVKGDSGAALVDEYQNIWGILIGAFNNRSVFMPIRFLLEGGVIQLI
jgi:hypothetical protein